MNRAGFRQGMESVSLFKMNTLTANYWLIYAAATVIWPYRVGYYFQSLSYRGTLNLALQFRALLIVTILSL